MSALDAQSQLPEGWIQVPVAIPREMLPELHAWLGWQLRTCRPVRPWTSAQAMRLLRELSPAALALVQAVVDGGGYVGADALGRSSFRGITGPITKSVGRLIAQGVLPPDTQSPVCTVLADRVSQRASGFSMDERWLPVFSACLAEVQADG